MRNVVLCVVLALVGCGPSAAEVRTAHNARYRKSPSELYAIARETAEQDYKIGEDDPANHRFATTRQWYSPEGGRQSPGAGNYAQLDDHSVNLSLVVSVVEGDMGTSRVEIEPVVLQYMAGSPQPRPLASDDPNMPPWIHGRVESLELAIYKSAKASAVEMTPAP